jgi:ribosomal protein S18 acetylase RimI-like enzyme
MRITVRRATPGDGPALWALNALPNVGRTADPTLPLDLPPPAGPPREFPDLADVLSHFVAVGGEFLVADLAGHVVGMGGFKPTARGAEVLRVRVHPATRRTGVGRALMAELEARAAALGFPRLHLDTADNQPEAVAFYVGLGYEQVRTETRPDWSWTLVFFEKELTPGS